MTWDIDPSILEGCASLLIRKRNTAKSELYGNLLLKFHTITVGLPTKRNLLSHLLVEIYIFLDRLHLTWLYAPSTNMDTDSQWKRLTAMYDYFSTARTAASEIRMLRQKPKELDICKI